MVVSKPKLVLLAAVAGALIWTEHANRIKIEALTPSEIKERTAAQACPVNDSVPYSTTCLAFIGAPSRSPDPWPRPDAPYPASPER